MDESRTKPLAAAASPAIGTAALAIALAGLALGLWAWWDGRDSAQALTQNLGVKLAEQSKAQNQTGVQVDQMLKDLRESQTRVAQLEGKLAEFQGQRVALEEMYRDLARAPDDWLLAEIEQTLNIASRELVLAANVRAALIALQAADQRLARADKLQVVQLRRAITQDMERLKALPLVDTVGISLKLDNLTALAATLPLAIPDSTAGGAAVVRDVRVNDGSENIAVRFVRDLWFELKQLVRIRELDSGDPALLSPQQSYFLRENLKLRLLAARTALIAHDDVNYKEDIKLARDMLTRYFDPKAKVNVNALAMLKQFAESTVSIAPPDITGSLNAVRAARAARERPQR
jgi:uroporphyrin-III C-methyltransferase